MSKSQIEYPANLHAPGAIDQLIAFHRQTFGGFRMEENGGNGGGDGGTGGGDGGQGGGDTGDNGGTGEGAKGGSQGGTGGDSGAGNNPGFPKDTPLTEMTSEQREAYWKHHARKHEDAVKEILGGRKPEDVKNDLAEMERIRQEQLTPSERAIEEAKAAAKAEARVEYASELVKAKFEAVLTHVDEARRTKIIEGLNLSSYLDSEGRVDTDKVKDYAAAVAPVDTTDTPPRRRHYGAGHRTETPPPRGAGGKAEAARRFGDKSKSTADA